MTTATDGYLAEDLIVYKGLQKGGYVGKGFRIDPPDCENADAGWLNRLEDDLRVVLASLKDGTRLQVQWSVDSDYKRELLRYYEATKALAVNPWSQRQRHERFTRYWERMENRELRRERLHLYVTSKIDSGDMPPGQGKREAYAYLLDASGRELRQYEELFQQVMEGLGGSAKGLTDLEHFGEFYRFFNASAADDSGVELASLFDPAESILDNCFNGEGAPLSKPDQGFYLDGYYHGILAIKSLPKVTFSGMISQLTALSMLDYAITVNIQPLDSLKEIEREERDYEKLQNTLQHSPKLRMLAAMQKKSRKISRLMSNEVLPYKAQFILRAWDKDKAGLRAKLAALRSAISKMGGAKYYDPALPTSSRNYFYASMPGWSWDKYDDYAHYIEDANLANLLPVSGSPTGDLADAEAIYDGANGNLVGVKTFAGAQGSESPQHGVMFGMSGAGKSVNMIDLLTQTEPYYDYTVIVEEGLSYGIYTQTVEEGAQPIILQPNGSLTFNYLDTGGLPLSPHHLANATALAQLMAGRCQDEDRNRLRAAQIGGCLQQLYRDFFDDWGRQHPDRLQAAARKALALQQWQKDKMPPGSTLTDTFVDFRDAAMGDGGPESAERLASIDGGVIQRALNDPALSQPIFQVAFAGMAPSEMPTHGHLHELMSLESHGSNGEDIRHLAKLIEPWCAHGSYGAILDGENNVNIKGKIAHFELGYIPESAEDLRAVAAFLITNHARNEVMSRPRGTRKRVILEELSAFLSIPNGGRITREFYERMRKYNCWVMSIVQQYERFRESPIRSSVMGNTRELFLLKQRDRLDLEHIGETFPLPEVTKHAIGNFPEPGAATQRRPYAGFVYYRLADSKPTIATAHNESGKEMLYASASNGAAFDKRARELKGAENVVEGIVLAAKQSERRQQEVRQ